MGSGLELVLNCLDVRCGLNFGSYRLGELFCIFWIWILMKIFGKIVDLLISCMEEIMSIDLSKRYYWELEELE